MEDISYFLSLPDEVLITEIFPRFGIDVLNRLCQVNVRFNLICQDETLWQIKTINEFPSLSKPSNISWKDYYRLLVGKRIPLYYQGDRISYIPFDLSLLNGVISLIVPYINQNQLTGIVNIVFIDDQRNLIIVVKYPEMLIKINPGIVQKVLIFVNDDFSKEMGRLTRGRGRKPAPKEPKPERDKAIIYYELTSSLGHPPIYGYSYSPENNIESLRPYGKEYNIITSPNGEMFRIIDNQSLEDIRIRRRGYDCLNYNISHLIDFLWDLNVNPPEANLLAINYIIQKFGLVGERAEYIAKWTLSNYSREQLCEIIKGALEQIGHII
jgi:hypothetical protein